MNLAATPRTIAAFESAAWLAELFSPQAQPQARRAPGRSGTLANNSAAHIAHPRGLRITCTDGSLWLTFDGQTQDTVLEAGESITCQHNAPLLISAFGSAGWRAD